MKIKNLKYIFFVFIISCFFVNGIVFSRFTSFTLNQVGWDNERGLNVYVIGKTDDCGEDEYGYETCEISSTSSLIVAKDKNGGVLSVFPVFNPGWDNDDKEFDQQINIRGATTLSYVTIEVEYGYFAVLKENGLTFHSPSISKTFTRPDSELDPVVGEGGDGGAGGESGEGGAGGESGESGEGGAGGESGEGGAGGESGEGGAGGESGEGGAGGESGEGGAGGESGEGGAGGESGEGGAGGESGEGGVGGESGEGGAGGESDCSQGSGCNYGEIWSTGSCKCICDPSKKCCGIQLNTVVPFIGDCIEMNTDSSRGDTTSVTSVTAFPILMQGLMKILMSAIMVFSFLMVIVAGLAITTGAFGGSGFTKGKTILKNVIISLILLGCSGLILSLVNPSFFGG